jgi:hypothetical protein
MLTGPSALHHRVDGVTIKIRDDQFRRGEHADCWGASTVGEIKAHVWGPHRFRPGTGPNEARADNDGRVTAYEPELPIGEELPALPLLPSLLGPTGGPTRVCNPLSSRLYLDGLFGQLHRRETGDTT